MSSLQEGKATTNGERSLKALLTWLLLLYGGEISGGEYLVESGLPYGDLID